MEQIQKYAQIFFLSTMVYMMWNAVMYAIAGNDALAMSRAVIALIDSVFLEFIRKMGFWHLWK